MSEFPNPYLPSNRNSQYNQPQQISDGSCNQELQSPGGLSSPQNSWGSVPSLNNGQNHQTGAIENDANSINYGQPPPSPLQSQSQQQVWVIILYIDRSKGKNNVVFPCIS